MSKIIANTLNTQKHTHGEKQNRIKLDRYFKCTSFNPSNLITRVKFLSLNYRTGMDTTTNILPSTLLENLWNLEGAFPYRKYLIFGILLRSKENPQIRIKIKQSEQVKV
jgi:hypothetical protein